MANAPAARRGLMISLIVVLLLSFGSLLATLTAGWSPKLGLDLAGGLSVVYKPDHPTTQANLQEVVTILSNRVDGLGVSGAVVNLQGSNVVVSVPGVKDARHVLSIVGQTAQLLFRPVICGADLGTNLQTVSPLPTCASQYQYSPGNLNVVVAPQTIAGFTSNNIPAYPVYKNIFSTTSKQDNPAAYVLLPLLKPTPGDPPRCFLGPAELSGLAVKKATAQQDQTGAWVVNYSLTGAGSPAWDTMAKKYFHARIAIELDGVVQSAPFIQPNQAAFTSFQGTGTISGSFTESAAKDLALAMNF